MAKDGPRSLIPAGALALALTFLSFLPACLSAGPDEADSAIASSLAVQSALLQANQHLQRLEYKDAVKVLESQLARINGNRPYLASLRDAYRGYIRELRQDSKDEEAKLYEKRLRILDNPDQREPAPRKGDPEKKSAKNPVEARVQREDGSQPLVKPAKTGEKTGKEPVFRANVEDVAPLDAQKRSQALSFVERADREFDKKRYGIAVQLYEQAHDTDQTAVRKRQDRWAYCKLAMVVEQFNHPPAEGLSLAGIQEEVRTALQMAPTPEIEKFAKYVLAKIDERRGGPSAKLDVDRGEEPVQPVAVRHGEGKDGWSVAETANFRILHKNQSRKLVEEAAAVAEHTRASTGRKWFGDEADAWKPACEIYLHATAQDYAAETSKPTNLPGHSTVMMDGSRIVSRRIDLHCDEPAMLTQRLPHEATHVVLAGQFGDQPLPRWADEGLAVLAEPREEIARYHKKLQDCLKTKQLFYFKALLEMEKYPEARRIDAFYCESVSLAEFLLKDKGPKTLTLFLKEGQRIGYEEAARKHYGFADYAEMQQHWELFAFGEAFTRTTSVDRGR